MELGQPVASLLSACSSFGNAQIRSAAAAAVAAVAEGAAAEEALGGSLDEPQRRAYAGLALLLTEAARLALPPAALRTSLVAEHGFSDARAALVAAAYELGASALRQTLEQTSSARALPRLLAARWRLDAPLAASAARSRPGAPPPPLFQLTLLGEPATAAAWGARAGYELQEGREEVLLRCALGAEQLQQLQFTLREALNAARRAASAVET